MDILKKYRFVAIPVLALILAWAYFTPRNEAVAPTIVGEESFAATTSTEAAAIPSTSSTAVPLDAVVQIPKSAGVKAPSASVGKVAPEFQLPSGFSNGDAFKLGDIVGRKVILVSFLNYTSKNSLRTLPYLNQLHERYKNKGLSVITVHTPRFAFDRSKTFVDSMAFTYNVYHPIVLDNQFATANAWGSKEWPTFYLVDINGKISAVYKGEGSYESIEAAIRGLLLARSTKLKLPTDTYPAFETPKGVEVVDNAKIKSSEVFFGSTQNSRLGNGVKHLMGMQDMKEFSAVTLNTLYLSGSWEFTSDYAKSSIEKNSITYRYSAKHVYALLGALKMSRVRVTLDGMPLGAHAGKDIREEKGQSYLYVSEERLYDVIRGDAYGEHTLEMHVETSGLEAYALQFG